MSDSSSNGGASGVGFGCLLTLAFIVLKLTHTISWSWWWVLSPIWIGAAVGLFVLAVAVVIAVVRS